MEKFDKHVHPSITKLKASKQKIKTWYTERLNVWMLCRLFNSVSLQKYSVSSCELKIVLVIFKLKHCFRKSYEKVFHVNLPISKQFTRIALRN